MGPVIGLVLLCVVGTLLNNNFATFDNITNVLTRTAFIGIIAVGMCFVIVSGGIDLSVGSMAALIAGSVILAMNYLGPLLGSPVGTVGLGMALALLLGAAFGLAHGLLITKGRIEPFIVTLGTLGIFRAYLTYFSNGGAITLDNDLTDIYSPVYYGSMAGIPIPVWVFLAVALLGGLILNRTTFGRYVQRPRAIHHSYLPICWQKNPKNLLWVAIVLCANDRSSLRCEIGRHMRRPSIFEHRLLPPAAHICVCQIYHLR
eukprot:gene20138-22886_t